MPDINSLLEKSKKKFKKSTYRPWNYIEQIQQEEAEAEAEAEVKTTVQVQEQQNETPNPAIVENSKEASKPVAAKENHLQEKLNGPISVKQNKKNTAIKENINQDQKPSTANLLKQQQYNPLTKSSANIDFLLEGLSGHQKNIFNFILNRCYARNELYSGNITIDELKTLTHTSNLMINTTIGRLREKELIIREKGKPGRGGYYRFSLRKEIMDAALIFNSKESQYTQDVPQYSGDKITADNLLPEINSYPHSFPEEWRMINFESLVEFGFNKAHLLQLYKEGKLNPEDIQDSIEHFAYDLKYNNKKSEIKTLPISYFMGILKRVGYYNPPENYISPRDKVLNELLERKKKERDEREVKIKELITMYFEEWNLTLNEEEKAKIIPPEIKQTRLTAPKIASLRSYFVENVWPNMKESKNIVDK